MVSNSIRERVVSRYDGAFPLEDSTQIEMKLQELETIRNECAKIGYSFNNINENKQESIWSNPGVIKIFGIFLCAIMVAIVKGVIDLKKENLEKKISKLMDSVSKVPIDNIEDKLVDTFEISSYEGFWQNFSSGGDEYQMRLGIFNTNLTMYFNEISIKIYFKDIISINYSTNSRGRYGAIVDSYLELYFDNENLIFSTSAEPLTSDDKIMLTNALGKIRIFKSNAEYKGQSTGLKFTKLLENTLTKLAIGNKDS